MRKLLALMVMGCALFAQQQQQPPAEKPKWKQKLFDIKYAGVRDLGTLINNSLAQAGARVTWDERMRVISVGGYDEALIQMASETIKRYDVPTAGGTGRNIEIIVHMMLAAPKGESGDAVPPDLAPVVKQLKSVFGYNDFHIVDSAVVRTREGVSAGAEVSGIASLAPGVPGAPNSSYQIRLGNTTVTPTDKGNIIRIDGFRFGTRSPQQMPGGNWNFTEIGFNTNLDVREGQKAVVGKSKIDGTDRALILVVSARAVD